MKRFLFCVLSLIFFFSIISLPSVNAAQCCNVGLNLCESDTMCCGTTGGGRTVKEASFACPAATTECNTMDVFQADYTAPANTPISMQGRVNNCPGDQRSFQLVAINHDATTNASPNDEIFFEDTTTKMDNGGFQIKSFSFPVKGDWEVFIQVQTNSGPSRLAFPQRFTSSQTAEIKCDTEFTDQATQCPAQCPLKQQVPGKTTFICKVDQCTTPTNVASLPTCNSTDQKEEAAPTVCANNNTLYNCSNNAATLCKEGTKVMCSLKASTLLDPELASRCNTSIKAEDMVVCPEGTPLRYVTRCGTNNTGFVCNKADETLCINNRSGRKSDADVTCAIMPPPAPNCLSASNSRGCDEVQTAIGPISTDLAGFILSIFVLSLSLSGGLAVLIIIYAGYRLMTSQGNPEVVKHAKELLTSAVAGFLFLIFSLVILEVIGVDILQIPGLSV